MATPSIADGDSDLSFEALTFGEDSGHIRKENKAGKKKSLKKDRLSAPQVCTCRERVHCVVKFYCVFCCVSCEVFSISSLQDTERDKNGSSVYVSTKNEADKIDVQLLLKRLELLGVVKASYFKEKQNFGFIQFLDPSVCIISFSLLCSPFSHSPLLFSSLPLPPSSLSLSQVLYHPSSFLSSDSLLHALSCPVFS